MPDLDLGEPYALVSGEAPVTPKKSEISKKKGLRRPNSKCKCKIKLTSISVTLRWLSVTPLTSRSRCRGRCGGNPEEAIGEKKRLRWKKVGLEERAKFS